MADIFLRDIDQSLKQALREILHVALAPASTERNAELARLAAISRAMSAGRKQTPSEVLLRESRDDR